MISNNFFVVSIAKVKSIFSFRFDSWFEYAFSNSSIKIFKFSDNSLGIKNSYFNTPRSSCRSESNFLPYRSSIFWLASIPSKIPEESMLTFISGLYLGPKSFIANPF